MITPYNFSDNDFSYMFIEEKNTLRIFSKSNNDYVEFIFRTEISSRTTAGINRRIISEHFLFITHQDNSKTFNINVSNNPNSHFKNYVLIIPTSTSPEIDSLFDNKYFDFYLDLFLTIKDISNLLNNHNQNIFFTFDYLSNLFVNDLKIKNLLLSCWSENNEFLLKEHFYELGCNSLRVIKKPSSIIFIFNQDEQSTFFITNDRLDFKLESSQVYSYEAFFLILHHCKIFFDKKDFILSDSISLFDFDKFSILEKQKPSILSREWLNYPIKIKL